MRIAILEDDRDQSVVLSLWLEHAGHESDTFDTGAAFMTCTPVGQYDLFIIDWELPDTSGIEVLDWIRQRMGWRMPVLFVTVRDDEDDIVRALEGGADDYMCKPLKHKELVARIRALERRMEPAAPERDVLVYGNYHIDFSHRRIMLDDEEIRVTGTEFELAAFLFKNANQVLSRNRILENVWQRGPEFNTRTVDTHMSRLRKKLRLDAAHGWRLTSVYRYGYRLEQLA
ncbi:MAG TPA: response regulator transcription factor [Thioalkalivibrio sp.]|nr:response regulator transcription factor [Thioalkalivibrio sp.]